MRRQTITVEKSVAHAQVGFRDADGKPSFRRLSLRIRDEIKRRNSLVNVDELSVGDTSSHVDFNHRRKSIFTSRVTQFYKKSLEHLFEPTYRMLPDERPELRDVKRILRSTLEDKCQGMNYEYFEEENSLVKLNSIMHRRIKAILPNRYRFVLQLICLQNKNQDLSVGSSYLWDNDLDRFTRHIFRSCDLTILSTCHLVYLE